MKKYWPYDPLANGGAGGPGNGSIPWRNANVLASQRGSIIDALLCNDLQDEVLAVIEAAGLEEDPDDTTQLLQAIRRLTRVEQTPGLETGYFDMYVPTEYPTLQAAVDYLAPLAIPNDVVVRINMAAQDFPISSSTGAAVLAHPNLDRIQIIGAEITGFPVAATMNQTSANAAETQVRSIWGTRFVMTGGVYAGLYVKGGSLGLLKNIAFIGDGTASQHGMLIGDWEHGLGAGSARIERCWAHRCGEDGFRANYGSAVISTAIGASWCSKQGLRVANGSLWTLKDQGYFSRNTQAGLLCVDSSFMENIGLTGGLVTDNNGLNGTVSYGNSELVLGNGATSRNNVGCGWFAGEGSFITNNYNTSLIGGGNTISDVKADIMGRMHMANAASLGLSCSPALSTVGNNNSYIMG